MADVLKKNVVIYQAILPPGGCFMNSTHRNTKAWRQIIQAMLLKGRKPAATTSANIHIMHYLLKFNPTTSELKPRD